jgi:vacuolar-type H+-ATPase subunit F/Vma7
MPRIIFLGEEREVHPYRLLGIETLVPPAEPADASWMDMIARGPYRLVLVSESVWLRLTEALTSFYSRLDREAGLTIIPDVSRPKSEHLALMRARTLKAIGVDTWTAIADRGQGKEP